MGFNPNNAGREVLPARLATGSIIVLALVFIAGSFRLGFERMGTPGPGLLTFIAGALLLPIAVRLFLHPASLATTAIRLQPIVALGTIAVYGLVLPLVGFVLPTFAVGVAWAMLFYRKSVTYGLVLGIGLAAGAVFVFRILLGVPLPLWPSGR